MKFKWTKLTENQVLSLSEKVHLSFNSKPWGGKGVLAADDGSSETALCIDGKYFILNGDWRKKYEAILENGGRTDECLNLYLNMKSEYGSSWSSDYLEDDESIIEWLKKRMENL